MRRNWALGLVLAGDLIGVPAVTALAIENTHRDPSQDHLHALPVIGALVGLALTGVGTFIGPTAADLRYAAVHSVIFTPENSQPDAIVAGVDMANAEVREACASGELAVPQ